jgi:hypothetical protein
MLLKGAHEHILAGTRSQGVPNFRFTKPRAVGATYGKHFWGCIVFKNNHGPDVLDNLSEDIAYATAASAMVNV